MRVAIIGTGWADTVQIPAFQAGGLEVVGVSGRRQSRAQEVADAHEVAVATDDWRDLLTLECDLISITSPPALHLEQTRAALQAGKHVLCEKPLVLNSQEATEMAQLAEKYSDKLTLVDHELRFVPARLKAKELLEQHIIGRVLTVNVRIARDMRLDPDRPWSWWSDASQGGGILGAIGSHAIDGLLWLFANVAEGDTIEANTTEADTMGADTIEADTVEAGTTLAEAFTIRGATLGQVHPTRRDRDGTERPVTADDIVSATFSMGSAVGTMLIHGAASDEAIDLLTIRGTEGTLVLDNSLKLYLGKGRTALKEYVTMLPGSVPNRFRANPFAAGTVLLAEAFADAFDDSTTPISQHPRLQHAATLQEGAQVQYHLDHIRALAEA